MTSPHLELPQLSRRTVLAGSAATAAVAVGSQAAMPEAEAATNRFFKHGVASGDPYPTSVVIWTRVTPTKRAVPGSGVGPRVVVKWELALDSRFRRVVKKGTFATGAGRDHTVKLAPTGLRPSTWYWYRFTYKGVRSRVGRTRTAPATTSAPPRVRLGVVSCSNLQAGWFASYRHLANRLSLIHI